MSTVAVPVLPVLDLERSIAWYERMGFGLRSRFDSYAILGFEGAELHLVTFEVDYPPISLSGAYLRVADADATFARWSAMGAPVIAAPEDQPYGIREWATEDPDGNLWRIGSPIAGGPLDGWVAPDAVDESSVVPDAPVMDAAAIHGDAPLVIEQPAPAANGATPTDGSAGTGLDSWMPIVAGEGRCAGCGLVPGELPARALGAQVRDEAHALGKLLAAADDDQVRERGPDGSWSALEYGVHVRDTLTVFAERIVRTLAEHEPELGWWDHEAAIEDGMANESDVTAVVDDLGRNAGKLSEALRLVSDDDWDRAATRREGERFTIELMGRFVLHEVVHHTADAQRALARAAG